MLKLKTLLMWWTIRSTGRTYCPTARRSRPAPGRCLPALPRIPIRSGYGRVWCNGRMQMVHRLIYEALVGPIPNGLTIDHLCRVRRCVNPDHMEPVTMLVNCLRGEGPTAKQARQTHCKNG